MDSPMSTVDFRLMAFGFRIRDVFRPRIDVLREVDIEPGAKVLDYGCGPGGYVAPLAELVGPTGEVYALDINPLAIETTRRLVSRKRIENVRTIVSDCSTGLAEKSVDAALLYDTFHHLSRPDDVLRELHRVLTTVGVLSVSDHHMAEGDLIAGVTGAGLFELSRRGKRTYMFAKAGADTGEGGS